MKLHADRKWVRLASDSLHTTDRCVYAAEVEVPPSPPPQPARY